MMRWDEGDRGGGIVDIFGEIERGERKVVGSWGGGRLDIVALGGKRQWRES